MGKIVVSACLLGQNCKYNGGNNKNEAVLRFLEGKEVIPVCPEVLGGLPVPRIPAELKDGEAWNKNGENVDEAFKRGVELTMAILEEEDIELAILQSRSPTCGVKQVYDGTFTGMLIDGQGLLAKALTEKGYRVIDAEDIVTVTIDRPLGSYHPERKDFYYPVNYGYIEGIIAPDGEEQDAYVLGVDEPVEKFTGIVIAIIHRNDDVEEKWVVAPEGQRFSKEEIMNQVHFQEQYFDSWIREIYSR